MQKPKAKADKPVIDELEDAPEAEPEEAEPDTRKLDEAKKVLLEQAEVLRLTVDKRWSVDTLAARVLEAQEAKDAADKAEFAASAKENVVLLRDAWPVADEKHLAGETIAVPRDIATKWYVAGVARPA